MDRGYIKLWRKSLESSVWDNPNLWRFWTYCLLKATWKPRTKTIGFQEVELQPGQFIFGRKAASKATSLSEQTIRTCLKVLNGKKLTIKTTNKFSIISIINWGTYQTDEHPTNQQTNQRITSNQPASNQQVTTNKNSKNIKNSKKEKYSSAFLEFYSHYPIRVGKDAAWRAWTKRNGDMPPLDDLKLAIDHQKQHKDALKAAGRFCPEWKHPSTWLNQGCWDDECTLPEKHELDGRVSPVTIRNIEKLKEWDRNAK